MKQVVERNIRNIGKTITLQQCVLFEHSGLQLRCNKTRHFSNYVIFSNT